MRLTGLAVLVSVFLVSVAPIEARKLDANAPPMTVGILLFDGVQIIDFTGPYEVFGQAGMNVWTASVGGKSITTHMGMTVMPTYALADAPRPDVLVLPGGNVPHMVPADDPRLPWILERAGASQAVLSVCNGVFYLASAGLLDGKRATTYAMMLEHLRMMYPNIEVVDNERVVDNGRVVTAGGLSSGVDGALYLVARLYGEARARQVANNMEYDWRPQSDYLRAKLADVYIHQLIDFFPPMSRRVDEVYEGDDVRWRLRWRIAWPEPVEKMRQQFANSAREAGWRPEGGWDDINWTSSNWAFTGRDGTPWAAQAAIYEREDGQIVLDVHVERG